MRKRMRLHHSLNLGYKPLWGFVIICLVLSHIGFFGAWDLEIFWVYGVLLFGERGNLSHFPQAGENKFATSPSFSRNRGSMARFRAAPELATVFDLIGNMEVQIAPAQSLCEKKLEIFKNTIIYLFIYFSLRWLSVRELNI